MLGRSQHCRDHRYEQRVEGVIAIRGDRQDLAYSETEWRARCGRFFDDNRDNINCVPDDWDDPNFYRSLPADPEGLLRWLRDYTAPRGSTPEAMFHIAIEILRAGMMPPDVKAQWYRAIAGIDGVETVEQTTLDG